MRGIPCNVVQTEGARPSLEDIPVVRGFPDVFSDEIPGMPPLREVEFYINLAPGATLVSRAPYRMTPVEPKELNT